LALTLGRLARTLALARPIPEEVLKAGAGELDGDKKVLKMLGARYGTRTAHGSEAKSG
jgi:hypothetical protein